MKRRAVQEKNNQAEDIKYERRHIINMVFDTEAQLPVNRKETAKTNHLRRKSDVIATNILLLMKEMKAKLCIIQDKVSDESCIMAFAETSFRTLCKVMDDSQQSNTEIKRERKIK